MQKIQKCTIKTYPPCYMYLVFKKKVNEKKKMLKGDLYTRKYMYSLYTHTTSNHNYFS